MRVFEDLIVYERARGITRHVYRMTGEGKLKADFNLSSQMRRAAVSIVSNIAEGSERGGDTEFRRYLIIARGSAGELRAQLGIARDVGFLAEADYLVLHGTIQQLGWMLSSLIAKLTRT